MGQPAAKQNDKVVGVDIHIVMVPAPPAPPIPTPLPHPFNGKLDGGLSSNVKITGKPAAILISTVALPLIILLLFCGGAWKVVPGGVGVCDGLFVAVLV
ncbi:MAG: PAAR domain-containing protein, partial [Chloroflexota bacterium]